MTQFYTVDELIKKFKVPKSTIYDLIRKGIIPGAMKIGRQWRFRQDMIESWIEKQTKVRINALETEKV